MAGPGSTSPWWKRTGIHFEPGWIAIHLWPGWDDHCPQAEWKVIHSPPGQWTGLLEQKWDPSSLGGPPNHPPGREGAGDWFDMYMRETQGKISEPPVPPYLIGTVEARREAIGQIYDRVARKEPPSHNITSRALRAYYTRVDPQTLSIWACQMLCMIMEYHMACVTRGSVVTSPILPRELAECLPPLADYAPPEDQSGTTNVRIRDHRARTLRVAVLCHRLDMALSKESASSGSLVRSRHRLGSLLAYFLSPGTAWEL